MAITKRKGRVGNMQGGALAQPIDPSEQETVPGIPAPQQHGSVSPLAVAEVTGEVRMEAPRRQQHGSTLGARAAARLLMFDDLPEGDKPRPDDRVLLVGLVWGDTTLVELERVGKGSDLPVRKLFDLPSSHLSKNFPIVKHAGNGHVVTLPASFKVEVHGKGSVSTLAQKGRRVDAPFNGHAYEIGAEDRVIAQLSPQLTLVSRYVRAGKPAEKGFFEQIDIPFASTILVSLLAFALFFLMVAITPRTETDISDDLSRNVQRLTKYQVKPPQEKTAEPRFKDLAGAREGEKAKGPEGKLGKEEAKKKEADPSRKGAPVVDPNAKHRADLAKIKKLGLVNALSKMSVGGGGGATDKVLGPGGLGSGINNSLGGTKGGAGLGDAYGVGGMGTRGTGTGGGGNALGIGGLGTKGSGNGRGGYGAVDLGGRGKDDTVFVPGRTTVVGGLSRDVINRVIQKHYNEIKYCYEKELSKDPGLYGKVTVLFVIGGTGRVDDALVQQTTMTSEPVESCMTNHVKRWVFPAPQGGGTVQVTYPYVFKASGQ